MKYSDTEIESPQNGSYTVDVEPVRESRLGEVDLNNPGFGTNFSDHMAVIIYSDGQWQSPGIVPFGEIKCSPSLISLHYGQTVFEGLKAFRNDRGEITIFRPDKHIERLNRSSRRMCIPEVDPEMMLQTVRKLVWTDRQWVPAKRGNSLYIRPIIFGSDNFLGVRPANNYICLIMMSPVGLYYKNGLKPVRLATDRRYIRAAAGGAGDVKTPGNYGVTLYPAREAQENGFDQILWLDAKEQNYVEEVGTMNIFFKMKDCLITPPVNGTILAGVTRDSVLQIAKRWGVPVAQRLISIDEVFDKYENGELEEIFGSGTAAVISPVGEIDHEGRSLKMDRGNAGPFTRQLYDEITGIQYGERPDIFGWNFRVNT